MEKCCCCSVRTASLIFGAFALLGSLLQLGKDGKEVIKHAITNAYQREEAIDIFYNEMNEIMDVQRDEARSFFKINFYLSIPDFILCLAMVVAAVCLIYGVCRKQKNFLIPAVVIFPLDFFMRVIFVSLLINNFGFSHPISITTSCIFFYGIIFDIFVWLCVFSHWQQLKEQECPTLASYSQPLKV